MINWKEKEDVLRRIIETIVMPKYPEIEDIDITSDFFRGVRRYRVFLRTNTVNDEREIQNDIRTLFKMSSLDNKVTNGRDYVDIFTV